MAALSAPPRHTPLPTAERLDGGLAALETLGLVLGRALYEGLLLDLPLAPFFVSRLQARRASLPRPPPWASCPCCQRPVDGACAAALISASLSKGPSCALLTDPFLFFLTVSLQGRWPLFDELQALDPEVYRSLMQIKRYDGDVADLCLDFSGGRGGCAARRGAAVRPRGSCVTCGGRCATCQGCCRPAWVYTYASRTKRAARMAHQLLAVTSTSVIMFDLTAGLSFGLPIECFSRVLRLRGLTARLAAPPLAEGRGRFDPFLNCFLPRS